MVDMRGKSNTNKHTHTLFLAGGGAEFNLSYFSKEYLNSSSLPVFLTSNSVAIVIFSGLEIPLG